MRSKFFKYSNSDNEEYNGYNPKISCKQWVFPEPPVVQKRITITIDYIKSRIKFKQELMLWQKPVHIPENRSEKKKNLRNYANDIFYIWKKR